MKPCGNYPDTGGDRVAGCQVLVIAHAVLVALVVSTDRLESLELLALEFPTSRHGSESDDDGLDLAA